MSDSHDLLKRAIAAVSVRDVLRKFNVPGIPERDGVKFCSVLRPDAHPSCTISEGKYHDWSQPEHLDSYDLYQRLTGKDSKTAFVPFIELSPLAHELQSRANSQHNKNGDHPVEILDWNKAVSDFTGIYKAVFEHERGYSARFVDWLKEKKQVGRIYVPYLNEHCLAFPIRDRAGNVVRAHCRRPERDSDGKSQWKYYPTKGAPLDAFILGDPNAANEVHYFESQHDANAFTDRSEAFRSQGVCVISTRGASNVALAKSVTVNPGAKKYFWPQNDEAGVAWGEKLVCAIGAAWRVQTPEKFKDINEATIGGFSADEIREAITKATLVDADTPPRSESVEPEILTQGPEVDRLVTEYATNLDDLPEPMREVAFRGLAGEIVAILEKHCEACREAILLQLLVMAGNILGRSIRLYASRDIFPNEYTIIVGATARARKGTSLAMVEALLWQIAPNWLKHRRVDGIPVWRRNHSSS